MTVRELIRAVSALLPTESRLSLPASAPGLDAPCTGVTHDSHRASPGSVFVALKGLRVDGATFAPQAIAAGAAAIVAESEHPSAAGVPWIVVKDARLALALLSAEFNGHPSRAMRVVAVTGTNGKTTTAYLVRSILEAAGIKCGLMGTVAYCIGDREIEASRTTPEAPEVQALLRQMHDEACGACVMEVSSHALALKRVDGMQFAAGIFTNLTRDHLDFHANMESYFAAKRRLFEMLPRDAPAVVNVDDPRGQTLIDVGGTPVTFGINRPADVSPGPLSFSLEGLSFDVRLPQGVVPIRSTLVGRPNVYNILGAVGVAAAMGIPFDAIERGVARLRGVPGRFEVVSRPGDSVTVIVDYAHTDDALRNLLETARPMASKRLITVFGAGGERDRTKRPLMGLVAARLSDVVVVTSDNPRGEDPMQIVDEVMRGVEPEARQSNARALTVPDRRDAIQQAVSTAQPGDVVLIAGKGHEKYQVIGGTTFPFDDVAVAREALDARRLTSGVG